MIRFVFSGFVIPAASRTGGPDGSPRPAPSAQRLAAPHFGRVHSTERCLGGTPAFTGPRPRMAPSSPSGPRSEQRHVTPLDRQGKCCLHIGLGDTGAGWPLCRCSRHKLLAPAVGGRPHNKARAATVATVLAVRAGVPAIALHPREGASRRRTRSPTEPSPRSPVPPGWPAWEPRRAPRASPAAAHRQHPRPSGACAG